MIEKDNKSSREQLVDVYMKMMSEKNGVNLTKKGAGEQIDVLFQAILAVLLQYGKLVIIGLFSFSVVTREEKQGRNPKTGKEITIPKSRTIKCKIGKTCKETLNQKS